MQVPYSCQRCSSNRPRLEKKIYVAASSPKLAAKVAGEEALVYRGGKLVDVGCFILGLAKRQGWKGVCLLGATPSFRLNREVSFSVFKLLLKFLGQRSEEIEG